MSKLTNLKLTVQAIVISRCSKAANIILPGFTMKLR